MHKFPKMEKYKFVAVGQGSTKLTMKLMIWKSGVYVREEMVQENDGRNG